MTYLELTEVKEVLEKRGIEYEEVERNGSVLLYVNGLMQIQYPTEKQLNAFWPDVRVSLHEGDSGYYVRACGMIYENQTIDDILEFIDEYINVCRF